MDAIEFQQMRRRDGAPLQFVDMHHIEAIAGAWIVRAAIDAAHGRAQGEAADRPMPLMPTRMVSALPTGTKPPREFIEPCLERHRDRAKRTAAP